MLPKGRGRGRPTSASREKMHTENDKEDNSIWLTFINRKCLSETQIRKVFEPFGGICECDGAVNGPSDGWVMVSVSTQDLASKCIQGLKDSGNPIGESISMLGSTDSPGNGFSGRIESKGPEEILCLRCGKSNHTEHACWSKDKVCKKCDVVGHLDTIHDVTDTELRLKVVKLLGAKPFSDWPETRMSSASIRDDDSVKIVTKKANKIPESDKFEKSDTFGGNSSLLSMVDYGDMGGLKNFTQTNCKILELASHNNLLLMERLRETVDDCNRQLKEKDDQIRRLQNLLNNHEENTRKLTNRLNSNQEFENKVKKFFGENEDYHKKKVAELTKQNQDLVQRLEESEKARMEKVLEESDSSKVRGEVEKLGNITDSILSKTEQVFAVVQGFDMGGVIKTDGKGDGKVDPMAGSTAALLHNKVDKAIRILAETSENQKKMNKVLQDLIKYTGLMKQDQENEGEEKKPKKKKDKDKERDRSRGRDKKRSRSRSTEKRRRSRSASGDRMMMQQVLPPAAIDHEFEEMKWALNMTLIGDGHWKSFTSVDDIKNIVQRMEKKVNFKILCNENEILANMYDEERDSLLVALPKTCYKVGISIGTCELSDPGLITLKDAPMDEVRRRNDPKLNHKARLLKELVLNLIRQNKQVIVMIPPHGEERMEVHAHWEEVLLAKLKDIRFPSIRILNMAQTMRGTMSEFKNNSEYLDQWLRLQPRPRRYLSAYGTRRMFYALRQTATAKTPQQAGMQNWPTPQSHPPVAPSSYSSHQSAPQAKAMANASAIAPPRLEDFNCPRCTKPGHDPENCRSIDKICRKCNIVGHFVEVHDIEDERYREVISKTLGINLWENSRRSVGGYGGGDYNGGEPDLKRGRMDSHASTRRIPLEKLAEMEQRSTNQWSRDYY